MLTRVDYTMDPATGDIFTQISYNASGIEKISCVHSPDTTDLEVKWNGGKITEVNGYENGNHVVTSAYSYAANTIRIDHELMEPPERLAITIAAEKKMQTMTYKTQTGKKGTAKFFRAPAQPLGKAVTEIILNGDKPEMITIFIPNEATGIIEETFKTEYTISAASTRYSVFFRDEDTGDWLPMMSGEFMEFENTKAPVTDNTLFLAMNGMYSGNILCQLFLRDAVIFNKKNYRKATYDMLTITGKEVYANTFSGTALTGKDIVAGQSNNPGILKAVFTY